MIFSRAFACQRWSLKARALVAPSVSSRTASCHCPAHMCSVPTTILTRPRPLLRARSPTPPEPNPWIDTRSDALSLVAELGLAGLLFTCCSVFAALTPDISSKVVGGVRLPCALDARGSSTVKGPPDVDGKTGIDMRCASFWTPERGDSGLLALGVCEFRRVDI
jgi:hypothetical protein